MIINKKTTIEKLSDKYFKKTGESPDYSFWSWLDSIGVNATEKELLKVLKNIDNYL